MLAFPSWSIGEVETFEPEFESLEPETLSQKSYDKKFSYKEQNLNKLHLRPVERFAFSQKTTQSAVNKQGSNPLFVQRAFVLLTQPRPLQKRTTGVALRLLPRYLPKTATSLPKPFKPTTSNTTAKTVKKETVSEKQQAKDKSALLEKSKNEKLEPHTALYIRDSLDEEKRQKRHFSAQFDDDLKGVKVKATATNCFKERQYKALSSSSSDRPFLVRPKVGIYALYYILTKLGIISDSRSHFDMKEEVHLNQVETEKTHQERLVELENAIADAKSTERWSVATQVFSWFTSFTGVATGIALLMSGTAPIAGILFLCGGLISITSQLLLVTDRWTVIAKKLPGTSEQKRMTIMWMQIGVAVLSLLLAGSGVVFGGFTSVKQAFETSQLFSGGVPMIGSGVLIFGQGLAGSRQKRREAEIRRHQKRLEILRHRRDDLSEAVEMGITRMENLFEALAELLEMDQELFKASEGVNR